jgi:hypothetical protein
MQTDTKDLVQWYIRVYESHHILGIIKLYNEWKKEEAKYKEDACRRVYAQLQQVMNSMDGKRRYRDRNYIRDSESVIIWFRLCEFDDVCDVFNNEASKEVNQHDHEPPLNWTKTQHATFIWRQPTYKWFTDRYIDDMDI